MPATNAANADPKPKRTRKQPRAADMVHDRHTSDEGGTGHAPIAVTTLADYETATALLADAALETTERAVPAFGVPLPVPDRYTVAIREMPTAERPRERLAHYGPAAVSTAELLAIQLRIGTKERSALGLAELLLAHFGGLRGVANASLEELARVKGIGPVKALEICASVELGKRLNVLSSEDKPTIRSPQDVANLLMPEMRDLKKEHLKSLLLDTKNRVMKIRTVSIGILDSSLVHPREVFQDAILASAAAIIVAHNHPSGDPTPSPEDKRVTTRLQEAGQILGIDLLDHIVIGDNKFVSLKQLGAI